MIKKYFTSIILFQILAMPVLYGQDSIYEKANKDIYSLINDYSEARDKKDTLLLKSILTSDIDQLVSTGEWRNGIGQSIEGMMRSSSANPGDRKLIIEKLRFLDQGTGIVDARYDIKNPDGSDRKMWSTFIIVFSDNRWKITGIRNMLPSGQ
jgi:hypothetical protein